MYARIITFQYEPGKIDEGLDFCANPLYQNSGSYRDTGARQTSWTVAIGRLLA